LWGGDCTGDREPAILLADDPTENLDTENSDLNKKFVQTVLMITRDGLLHGA